MKSLYVDIFDYSYLTLKEGEIKWNKTSGRYQRKYNGYTLEAGIVCRPHIVYIFISMLDISKVNPTRKWGYNQDEPSPRTTILSILFKPINDKFHGEILEIGRSALVHIDRFPIDRFDFTGVRKVYNAHTSLHILFDIFYKGGCQYD